MNFTVCYIFTVFFLATNIVSFTPTNMLMKFNRYIVSKTEIRAVRRSSTVSDLKV